MWKKTIGQFSYISIEKEKCCPEEFIKILKYISISSSAMIFLQMHKKAFTVAACEKYPLMMSGFSCYQEKLTKVSHQDTLFASLHIQIGWSPYWVFTDPINFIFLSLEILPTRISKNHTSPTSHMFFMTKYCICFWEGVVSSDKCSFPTLALNQVAWRQLFYYFFTHFLLALFYECSFLTLALSRVAWRQLFYRFEVCAAESQ